MPKLWHKDYELDEEMEDFSVGEDHLLDMEFVEADILGSIAHARMLSTIGILSEEEFFSLKGELLQLLEAHERGEFAISKEDEDVHTAVENVLTARLGDPGRKLHTARSRNDQVLVDTRLYARGCLLRIELDLLDLVETLAKFARQHHDVPMPGRTHTQRAMASSAGLWAGSFAESLLDDLELLKTAYRLNNQNPLGSAASYGVPLPIDRQLTTDLLGFEKIQNNVLYCNNSRGKMEAIILSGLMEVLQDLTKLSNDVILFSVPEFGYFSLPDRFCPGSSIMPQKKNPCPLELVRAKCSTLEGYLVQILGIRKGLYSGYNRDFQETKGPFLRGLALAASCIRVMDAIVETLEVNRERLAQSFTPELFAADEALEMAAKGIPFRAAYKHVGLHLDELKNRDPRENILSKTHIGAPGNLGLEVLIEKMKAERAALEAESTRLDEVKTRLLAL